MPAKSGEVCAVFSISYDGLCALLTYLLNFKRLYVDSVLFTHLFTHDAYTVAVSGFSVTETKKDRAAGFLSKPYRPFLISIFLTLLGLR